MGVFILWLVLAIIPAAIASNKGRSGFGFFVLSVLLSPLIGLIIALLVAPDTKAVENARIAAGENKKCPFCAELIKAEAVVCRYCGKDVPAAQVEQKKKYFI